MDYLKMEEEFIKNQEILKPKQAKEEEDRSKVDELRGTPMSVGTLEEIIDDSHAIVSSSVGPEYYVSILSIVDHEQLEPGASVLLHNKSMAVVGVLSDSDDPLVSTMKVDKAPLESYADIGGLEQQIIEIKEAVELPLTHPELYQVCCCCCCCDFAPYIFIYMYMYVYVLTPLTLFKIWDRTLASNLRRV